MRRGEVWWASVGRKRRPVLILTRDTALPLLDSVTVAPATRTVRGIPSEVAVGRADRMPGECALAFDNIQTIGKGDLRTRITRLEPSRLEEVCEALRYALGC